MFFLIIIPYLLACVYIGWRSAQALTHRRWLRVVWRVMIGILSTAVIMGLGLRGSPGVGKYLWMIGTVWVVTTPYWLTATLFWNIIRVLNKWRPIFPGWVRDNYARAKLGALILSIIVVAGIFGVGYWRFSHPVTTVVNIKIDKPAGTMKSLHAVVASDWHLGEVIRRARVADYVNRVNALSPDIILLPGDIIDRNLEALVEQNMGPELQRLHAPLGVYAIMGNHESYANSDLCEAYLEKYGIRVLRDRTVKVADAFYIVGRDYARNRKAYTDLLAGVDRSMPIIAMDHDPRDMNESKDAGVDLQLSGHTHGGQIWPVTWIIPFLYEVPYGYKKKGDFQIYVSSGLGLWGIPARIGSVSELVDLHVEFGGEIKK